MWDYERLGGQGAPLYKPETLAVTVNKLTEGKSEVQKEDIRRQTSDVKTERGKSSAPLFKGTGLHLCVTPGCYRASVYVHSPASHHSTMSRTIQVCSLQQ